MIFSLLKYSGKKNDIMTGKLLKDSSRKNSSEKSCKRYGISISVAFEVSNENAEFMLLMYYDPRRNSLECIYLTTFNFIINVDCILKGQDVHNV